MLKHVTIDDFASREGQAFRLELGEFSEEFKLVQVDKLKYEYPNSFRKPFSLLFEGDPSKLYPQATYLIEHPDYPEKLPFFLVPVQGDKPGSMYLEAVFT
jgi:hypothetical protein